MPGTSKAQRRLRIIVGLLVTIAATPPLGAAAQPSLPSRPLTTGLSHWDDHWFIWLPHHPVYEAIEVAMRDPDATGHRDVWVWLSERAGNKRQVHYRNNPRLLRYPPSTLRTFDYQVTGAAGAPRGLRLSFTDENNVPIIIAVDVDPRHALRPDASPFTTQGDHSANLLFLLFYRARGAEPTHASATIGGTNFSFRPGEEAGPLRFKWGYNRGIDIGVISYGTSEVQFGPGGFLPVAGRSGAFATTLADGGVVTLAADAAGRLADYSHVKGDRALRIRFDPALPSCRQADEGGRSGFRLSMPELVDAVRGEIETICGPAGATYVWRPAAPGWAVRQPFTSIVTRTGEGRFALSVARGARDAAPH